MSSSSRLSLLECDAVRRRASMRSMVGRAWERLQDSLWTSPLPESAFAAEDQVDSAWQRMEDVDEGDECCYDAPDPSQDGQAVDGDKYETLGKSADSFDRLVDSVKDKLAGRTSASKSSKYAVVRAETYASFY